MNIFGGALISRLKNTTSFSYSRAGDAESVVGRLNLGKASLSTTITRVDSFVVSSASFVIEESWEPDQLRFWSERLSTLLTLRLRGRWVEKSLLLVDRVRNVSPE